MADGIVYVPASAACPTMCPTLHLAELLELLERGLVIEVRLNPPTTAGAGGGTPRPGRFTDHVSAEVGARDAGLRCSRGPELEPALAEVRQAVRLANPAEARTDEELDSEAVAYLEGQERPVSPEELRTLAGEVAERGMDDPNTAKAASAEADTIEIRSAIGGNRWARRLFEPVISAARIAGADPYRWIREEGLDLTTKPGRDRARKLIKAGIPWERYVPHEKLP